MKILKKAEQKNVTINKDYYTSYEINVMLAKHEICYFDKGFNNCYDAVSYWDIKEETFRIFTDDLSEIKVALDEYNCYTTVAIGKNGKIYYVNI